MVTIATIIATFEGGLEQQAELMNKMSEHVDAVVIITNQIGDMSDVSCILFCVGMVEGMCLWFYSFRNIDCAKDAVTISLVML